MLEDYGWTPALRELFAAHASEGLIPARIIVQQRNHYTVITAAGETGAQLAGRFVFSVGEGTLPVTGDWVALSMLANGRGATIHHLLPRHSAFVRKAVLAKGAQVVAANVDVVMIVTSLDADLNLRRIERTLAMAWESGATPVLVLTKADLCADVGAQLAAVAGIAGSIVVLPVSARTGQGMQAFQNLIQPGKTAVVLGSSGAGKSTLVNALLGRERMATQAIRASDGRGRHTTTHRELVLLPQGGCMLDTPGMRELGLWEAEAGIAATFADIEALARQCRFGNCSHTTEPGCAVQQALADGSLDSARWGNYGKLQGELAIKGHKETRHAVAENKPRKTRPSRPRQADEDED